MPEVNGTCEYVLDPDKPETWGGEEGDECHVRDDMLNEDGVWTCPHDAEDFRDRCIFHQRARPSETDAFLDTIDEATPSDDPEAQERRLEFIGAKFRDFELGEDSPDVLAEETEIVMTHAQFDGQFEWSADVSDIRFRGATFISNYVTESIKFRRMEFGGEADFSYAEFGGEASFYKTEFGGEVDFSHAEFGGEAGFMGAEFRGEVDFSHAEFGGEAGFMGAEFRGEAYFDSAEFGGKTIFYETEFRVEASFYKTEFGEKAYFHSVEFGGDIRANFKDAEFGEYVTFYETEFGGKAYFRSTKFGGEATFTSAEFGDIASFRQAKFNGDPDFTGTYMTGTNFEEAHLEGADFDGTNLAGANLERAKLSNADLFGTDLSGARLYGARIGDARINTETVFDRHGQHRCVYDPNSEYEYDPDEDEDEKVDRIRKAMGAYHVLEQLTRANTLPDEQSKFFARRQDMRRAQLRQQEEFPRFNYWFSKLQNLIFRHGESFSRVVGCSIGTIVFFALVFPLGGWVQSESTGTITYGSIAESPSLLWQTFYHSTLLFLTGVGPLDTTGTVGEVLTTVEALVAPILLALLVFVLGRRAAR
jgi:uncharacterized protein YjbI with pentapeptide repeats